MFKIYRENRRAQIVNLTSNYGDKDILKYQMIFFFYEKELTLFFSSYTN